ncbi:alpha/beta hydrolase [Cellulomonas fimi]|uniref:Phospholipase/Carboxylesterase n=1 Tax=Cellulomonas fimi (strain ATCC 484 / DSM 20113 / JCM 1341 / CCUG 24087 / LMG 16345 / NBRC 15513 / NCIMB 8980 / NCTC 7547 / NRS-133) TaxID=590998 RepID=F4H7Y8_CELFA|nr:alpha/beta hydrolase [Cellulomonas fimi]AEE46949.1 phospholipase/Carboxylesterase [Cellulomonas fimi ATCC 484]NNH08199.1 alpha/beta hydrolase [Cellulomonas fimi]VEH34653.1 Monoterpene epsilon-lactone hydrolase [Cellulomonas fimi]
MTALRITSIDGTAPHGHGVVWMNVPYAEASDRTLHVQVVWPPIADWSSPQVYPTVVFVQGSGWGRQELGQWLLPLAQLARRGYVVAVVEHRPSDVAPFPAQVEDVRSAVRFLRAHADRVRVDPGRVALWGDSSGGHLVLLTAVTDGMAGAPGVHDDEPLDVRAVVDFYGPSDLARMPEDPACVQLLGGVDPRRHAEAAAPAAVATHVRPVAEHPLPPMLVVHGSDDEVVPFEQSVLLAESLLAAGQPVELVRLEGAGHGAGAFFGDAVMDVVDRFLRRHLLDRRDQP